MIRSALIEPRVSPLVARGGLSGCRSTALVRSRLCATALLAVSALIAVATCKDAEAAKPQAKVVRTAHKRPTRVAPARPVWADAFAVIVRQEELPPPARSPEFENEALRASRHRHDLDPGLISGPGLTRGRRLDRLLRATDLSYLIFGSAKVLAAQPHS